MPFSWNLIDSESFRELIARRLYGLILPRNRAHAHNRIFIDENDFGHEHQPSQSYGLAGDWEQEHELNDSISV